LKLNILKKLRTASLNSEITGSYIKKCIQFTLNLFYLSLLAKIVYLWKLKEWDKSTYYSKQTLQKKIAENCKKIAVFFKLVTCMYTIIIFYRYIVIVYVVNKIKHINMNIQKLIIYFLTILFTSSEVWGGRIFHGKRSDAKSPRR